MTGLFKISLLIIGCTATILGMVGIFLPGLPTTPLLLLASWCFYKSSPKLRKMLLDSFLGKYIKDYEKNKGITAKKKICIILFMAAMVSISTIFFIDSAPIRLTVIAAGMIGCIVVTFVVPTIRN